MNLTKIRYFVEVAKCKSFTQASKNLFTAQPNLSKQVAQMEKELGIALFVHNRRFVQLTPAGEFLYEQLKEIPAQLDDIFSQADAIAHDGIHELSIGILDGQELNTYLSSCLKNLSCCYADIDIKLERGSFRHLRNGLYNGTYDIIFTFDFDINDIEDFDSISLFTLDSALLINKDNPLANLQALTFEQLKEEPFIVISKEESPNGYDRFMTRCHNCGFEPTIARELSSTESLLLSVEAGFGVALMDKNTRLENNHSVRTITIDSDAMDLSAAWSKNNTKEFLPDCIRLLKATPMTD